MTAPDLDTLQALCDAATPGWEVGGESGEYFIHDGKGIDIVIRALPEDLAFIAAARTALPELIARVRDLEDHVYQLKNQRKIAAAERDLARTAEALCDRVAATCTDRQRSEALDEYLSRVIAERDAARAEMTIAAAVVEQVTARAEAAERRVAELEENPPVIKMRLSDDDAWLLRVRDRIVALESALRVARDYLFHCTLGGITRTRTIAQIDAALAGEGGK